MKVSWSWWSFFIMSGCGGRESVAALDSGVQRQAVTDGSSSAASDSTAGDGLPVDVGGIDASGQPSELVMNCDGRAPIVSLSLPCKIGRPVSFEIDLLACELSNAQDIDAARPSHVAVRMLVMPKGLAAELGQPIAFPTGILASFAPSGPGSGEIAGYPGEGFAASITGTAIFSQVDLVERAFIGRLQQATVTWAGSNGDSFSCSIGDGPFWAVAGDF